MKIVDIQMISHMALDTEHISLSKGRIKAEGHIANGRTVIIESHVKKRKGTYGEFGKSEVLYYLNEKDSPTFPTAKELFDYYQPDTSDGDPKKR